MGTRKQRALFARIFYVGQREFCVRPALIATLCDKYGKMRLALRPFLQTALTRGRELKSDPRCGRPARPATALTRGVQIGIGRALVHHQVRILACVWRCVASSNGKRCELFAAVEYRQIGRRIFIKGIRQERGRTACALALRQEIPIASASAKEQ